MSTTNTSTTKKQKIPFNELKIQREIGSGSYGKVYLGKWKGISVALKFCELEGSVDEFISEINVQMYFDFHSNLLIFILCLFVCLFDYKIRMLNWIGLD
jgi:serine/threonine protein kinase